MTSPCSAIVLAGGKSSRLGQDKRSLHLAAGRTQLEETVSRVAMVSADVVIAVDGAPERYGHLQGTVVIDERPGCGPLGGLCAGLAAIRNDCALVVACDLPFLSIAVLRALLARACGQDLVVPRRRDRTLEMLHGVYRKTCLPVARRRLAASQLKLTDLALALIADGLTVRFVDETELVREDPELRSFVNVNTPEDLRVVQTLLRDQQST